MNTFHRLALSFIVLFLTATVCARAADKQPNPVNFGSNENMLELKSALSPYRAPGGAAEPDGSSWYIVQVSNDSVRPATRVLLAGQPPRAALSLIPRRSRPAILAVASSDSGTVVETASAYGRRAWRVIVPPVSTVGLAIRVGSADAPPALSAWTEPALSSHNRQLAIFITAVGALIAAAALITGGLAVLIGHAAPRWVALTLMLLLLSWLSGTGMFDANIATRIGGPYGLSAFLTVLALAAGARLADAIIPLRDTWPKHEKLFHRGIYGLMGLGALAYLGLPGATLLTDFAIVLGSVVVAAYLIYCGRVGHKAAQVIAPSAAAFALVAVAAAVMALGGLGENLTGPAATGGFAAAGAILLALAVIASEEIAVLPFLHGSFAAKLLEAQAPAVETAAIDPNAPFNSLARAAIGAARQGVFDLDFRAGLLTLSAEAARMVGLSMREATLSHSDWIDRIDPEDREVYADALEDYRHRPGLAFRLEFRVRGANGSWRWLELRATIVSEQDVPSDCLGLISDVTQRKEAEFAQAEAGRKRDAALPRDGLTGLGNRVALMQALDGLGEGFGRALLALLDVDRFKAVHASLGDPGADSILKMLGERLAGLDEPAQLFRVGGDSFAFLFADPGREPQAHRQCAGGSLRQALWPGWTRCFCALQHRARRRRPERRPLRADQECRAGADRRQAAGWGLRPALFFGAGNAGPRRQCDAGKRASSCADRWPAGRVLPAHHPAFGPQRGRFRGVVALAASGQGPDRARRFHRPFGRNRVDRGTGPAGAGTRRHRSRPLAALFSAEAAAVRQRQFLPPPAEGCGF